jgi:hypothetical protein
MSQSTAIIGPEPIEQSMIQGLLDDARNEGLSVRDPGQSENDGALFGAG